MCGSVCDLPVLRFEVEVGLGTWSPGYSVKRVGVDMPMMLLECCGFFYF